MDQYPKFERRENENVTMLMRGYDEFGDETVTRHYFSEATAERMLQELKIALNERNT